MPRPTDIADQILDDRYELIEPIGEGTFGRVYRGYDRRLEREVAVKVIKPWWAEDPVWVERFAREARTLARVTHVGIVQIFDVGQAGDSPYYVAELIEGGNLADRLRSGPLAPAQAADIAQQLCRALAQAHRQHVVHRDVKPANILLCGDGRVKVSDFGVARLADGSSHGAAATAIGTPRYMSPEQARGEGITAASDVYGVGVVLYEMLAGHPPFRGDSAVEVAVRHLNDPPPPLPGTVSPELAAVVTQALAKDPKDRFADGAAMADALAAIPDAALRGAPAPREVDPVPLGGEPTALTSAAATNLAATRLAQRPPPPPPPPQRVGRTHRSGGRRRLIGALALIAALIALIVILTAGGTAHTTVPHLTGLHRSGAQKRAKRNHLHAVFGSRYSDSGTRGTVIAQRPGAGTRVKQDSDVDVTLSRGPRPIPVPGVVGKDVAAAEQALASAGLHANVTRAPAPGKQAGTVTAQSPGSSAKAPPGSTIALTVVAAPRWRTVTSVTSTGDGDGRSVPFRIRGDRWRAVYDLHYNGNCTLLLVCLGPSADAVKTSTGETVDSFDMGDGTAKTHEVGSGPGVFEVRVGAGDDSSSWTMRIQDHY